MIKQPTDPPILHVLFALLAVTGIFLAYIVALFYIGWLHTF
jgi:hypothetical protein